MKELIFSKASCNGLQARILRKTCKELLPHSIQTQETKVNQQESSTLQNLGPFQALKMDFPTFDGSFPRN